MNLPLLVLVIAEFGDRQGTSRTIRDASHDILVVVRAFGGRPSYVRLMESLKRLPVRVATCGDVGQGDFHPMFTARASRLMHSTDDHLPAAWGDSPHWRRWKISLVVDLFGCLLAAEKQARVIVYLEDDVVLLPTFLSYVQEFARSQDRVWWGMKQMGTQCFMVRSSAIQGLYSAVEPRWMLDPADWLIWGNNLKHAYTPARFDNVVLHAPGASTHPGS